MRTLASTPPSTPFRWPPFRSLFRVCVSPRGGLNSGLSASMARMALVTLMTLVVVLATTAPALTQAQATSGAAGKPNTSAKATAGTRAASTGAAVTPFVDAARGPTAVVDTTKPPLLGNAVNDDLRRTRNYAMQPPTIPHRVDGYQVDKNFNKCLDCHARSKTSVSQAIPVSVTHYMDRDGHMLGQVSTRRYFCMQCHVPQDAARPLVDNRFEDVDTVIQRALKAAPASR